MKIRRFRIADDRHLVLPLGLQSAPGARHLRMHSGATIELDFDDPRVRLYQRFLANRIKLGDLIELDAAEPTPAAPTTPAKAAASSSSAPFVVNPPTPASPAQGGK